MVHLALALTFAIIPAPVFGELRVQELDPPIPIVEGQRFDMNQDGLVDFEIDEFVHEEGGEEVRSMRLVGLTHIHYPDGIGFNPVLLHSRFRGLYNPFDIVPGSSPFHLKVDPVSFVFSEFLRFGPDDQVRGEFDEWGRSYLGGSVETLEGIHWGWIEVTLDGGAPAVSAIGYESIIGAASVVGGMPLSGAVNLEIAVEDGAVLLSWSCSDNVDYRFEASHDLKNWLLLDLEIERDGMVGTGRVIRLDSEPRRYFRLLSCRKGRDG